jgi:hypothetical protein
MNVINRFNAIRPNITFKIETTSGTVLHQFSTGDIIEIRPCGKYGFYFTTPAINNGIVLRMTNNAPGGIGNDLALDDIFPTLRPDRYFQYRDIPIPLMYVMAIRICTLLHQLFLLPIILRLCVAGK